MKDTQEASKRVGGKVSKKAIKYARNARKKV